MEPPKRRYLDLRAAFRDGVPPIRWLAKPWLVRGEVHNVIASGGTGKSILLLDIAIGLATSTDIFGGSVKVTPHDGPVVYFDRDAGDGQTIRRITALGRGRFGDAMPDSLFTNLYISCDHTISLEGPGLKNLSDALDELKPSAVFFDALRAFHTKEENTSRDMAFIYREVLRSIADNGAAVVVIHHEGKPSEWRTSAATASRGSTEITDAADTNMRITADARTGLRTIEMAKARNLSGADWPRPLKYRLDPDTEEVKRIVV